MSEPISNAASSKLALESCVQVFDDAFDANFCQQMIRSFHSLARFHRSNGRGVQAGFVESAWTELDITDLTDAPFRQILLGNMHQHLQRYNQKLAQPIAIPGTDKLDRLVIKRYRAGSNELFETHFDAIGNVANRYLVFLWYLNDVAAGGETAFPKLEIAIQPKAGRLLMFPPYWMFQHEGRAPSVGEKYILSSYFLF